MALTHDRRAELLAGCPLFHGIDAEGLARLAERATQVDFPAGHVIARQGEIGTGFFVIISGAGRPRRQRRRPSRCRRLLRRAVGPGSHAAERDGRGRGGDQLPGAGVVGLRCGPPGAAGPHAGDPARRGGAPPRGHRIGAALMDTEAALGTRAFLFSDIEGSTRSSRSSGPPATAPPPAPPRAAQGCRPPRTRAPRRAPRVILLRRVPIRPGRDRGRGRGAAGTGRRAPGPRTG